MARFKLFVITLVTLMGITMPSLAFVPSVYAAPSPSGPSTADPSTEAAKKSACEGIGGTYKKGECVTKTASLDSIIGNVVNILSVIVGVAAVIMIMVGGLKYITAAGDSSKVSSAKSTIIYAIIGIVIVAMAQAIVKFVIKSTI